MLKQCSATGLGLSPLIFSRDKLVKTIQFHKQESPRLEAYSTPLVKGGLQFLS
jgi:hypothetical protein